MAAAFRGPRLFMVAVVVGLTLFQLTVSSSYAQITPLGQRGCARGTSVGGPNLVVNGDFAIDAGAGPGIEPAAGFTSSIINRGPNTYPSDPGGGGFSIQTGPQSYVEGLLIGKPFPGDPQRDVPASQTYFYSNPIWLTDTLEVMLWRQEITVVGGTTYNFFAYFDNLIRADANTGDPLIELRVDGVVAGPPVLVQEQPDEWLPVQFAFTTAANQTTITLEIYDLARDQNGDDFAMTQVNLKQCVSALGLAKQATFLGRNSDGSSGVEYLFTLRNFGVDPEPLRSIQVYDDLAQVFANAGGFSIVSLTSPTLPVNPSFDGRTDTRLLDGVFELAAQQTATITLRLAVFPGGGANGGGPFENSARASATAGNLAVIDLSTPGTDPDPSGNGNPQGTDNPTSIFLSHRLFVPQVVR